MRVEKRNQMKSPDTNKAAVEHEPILENLGPVPSAKLPSGPDAAASPGDEANAPEKLTPEEQMALYEEHLKENDWGHQPC